MTDHWDGTPPQRRTVHKRSFSKSPPWRHLPRPLLQCLLLRSYSSLDPTTMAHKFKVLRTIHGVIVTRWYDPSSNSFSPSAEACIRCCPPAPASSLRSRFQTRRLCPIFSCRLP